MADPSDSRLEPIVGALRMTGGARAEAAVCAASLTPPAAARGREDERLFFLLDLTGPATSHLYRELREIVAQTYWSSQGSITAGLRQAAAAANRRLFQFNLEAAPPNRCYGALACAVLRGEDLFLLQTGPVRACMFHGGRLDCFPADREPLRLGMSAMTDALLHHTFVGPGDTLLLASTSLIVRAGADGLARVLPRINLEETLAGLEQLAAGIDAAVAMVARMVPSREAASVESPPIRRPAPAPPATTPPAEPRRPSAPPPIRAPSPDWNQRVGVTDRRARTALTTIGRRLAAAGTRLSHAARTLARRMLPGPERDAYRRARPRRPIPPEKPAVMIPIAAGIPALVLILVAVAYILYGREARFTDLVAQAEQEIVQAEYAAGNPEEERAHWEAALEYASAAARQRPDDPQALDLQNQAQAALDQLDGIIRLTPLSLARLGSRLSTRLAVHGQSVFVLDRTGWVIQVTLTPAGDGLVEDTLPLPLVQTGDRIDQREVGKLVDLGWAGAEGGRQTSGLLILEEDGAIVTYDPTWQGTEGAPQLTRTLLGTPPSGRAQEADIYQGHLYILDPLANQVWDYAPRGNTYPDPPSRCFITDPPKPLDTALDIAVDGNLYILYRDGTILKFLDREPQAFQVRGVPGGVGNAIALAAGRASGRVYVADLGAEETGDERVLVLEADGAFRAQLRAEGAFDNLQTFAVDEANRRLFAIGNGQIYVAALP